MRFRLIKYLTPVLQPMYKRYLSKTRTYSYKGIHVHVWPGVFYPGFISTRIFLQFVGKLNIRGKSILELGAGTGIISVFAASKGAIVTATDINPISVNNTQENAKINKVNLSVIKSDLFENIPQFEFDYILIAPPYYPRDPNDYAQMAWFCGQNFEYFVRLFKQLNQYYHPSIQIFMILSEDCNLQKIMEIAYSNGFKFNMVLKKKRLAEWNYIYGLSMR
jgi:release factor glutamine methyltransferase